MGDRREPLRLARRRDGASPEKKRTGAVSGRTEMVRRTRKTKRRQVAKAAMLAIRYAARPIRRRTRTRGGEKQTRKITRDPAATQRWEEWKRRPPRSDGTRRAPGYAEALKTTREEVGSR